MRSELKLQLISPLTAFQGSAHVTDRIIEIFMQTPVQLSALIHKAVGLPATDDKFSFTGLGFGQKVDGTRSNPYVSVSLIRGDPRPRNGRGKGKVEINVI